MRPKKLIVLVASDDQTQGEVRFLLTTHAYAVHTYKTVEQMHLEIGGLKFPRLVIVHEKELKRGEITLLDSLAYRLPVLWVSDGELPVNFPMTIVRRKPGPAAEFLDVIRVMTIIKRGPAPRVRKLPVLHAMSLSDGAVLDADRPA